MNTINIHLPESLLKAMQEVVRTEGISINQFVVLAVAEKLSAWRTAQVAQASRASYDAALSQVPDTESEEYDRIQN